MCILYVHIQLCTFLAGRLQWQRVAHQQLCSQCVYKCFCWGANVRLAPTHSEGQTAQKFAHMLLTEIPSQYGLPDSIVTDCGVQWNTDFFRELCDHCFYYPPKYRLDHPGKMLLLLSKRKHLDQSIQKVFNLNLKTEALSATLPKSVQT